MNSGSFVSVGGWAVDTGWAIQGVGDFNGDKKSDILWRNRASGEVNIWLMSAGTVLSSVGRWVVGNDWMIQGVGDFNGDGKKDILWRQITTGRTAIWQMNGGTLLSSVGRWIVSRSTVVQGSPPRTVTLAWSDGSSNEAGFKIERSPDGTTNWTQIGTTGAGALTYADIGVAPLTTYYYRVRAYNAASNSAYSNVVSVTTR